jgi:ATP-dependent RNA helicase DDX35
MASEPLFWRPGASRPADLPSLVDREPRREEAGAVVYNPNKELTLAQQRRRLPIYEERRALLHMVETYATLVVVGHTGCGKSTQLPQYLHEAGWTADGHVVACTQPRRVAATSVATRVADEMGVALGTTVGYAVRFDDCFDASATRLKYMTDGRLIREMMSDPLLSQYSVVMVDEAHERSTQTDILLGLLKKIRRRRPELRLVVASATLDAELFARFFEEHVGVDGQACEQSAAVITLNGSGTHPVAWHFLEQPVPDYLAYAVDTALQIHLSEEPGDILVFLTGQQEVDAAVRLLTEKQGGGGKGGGGKGRLRLLALPIFSGLSAKAQFRVFEPPPKGVRKVVVATNIAETSLTIDGIVHVVDCTFSKQRFCQPSGEETLVIAPISQASARQRAGRAGRSRPGSYFPLLTEAAFTKLAPQTPPEMQRCSLTATVLQLKALGVDNVLRFDFLSPPPPELLANALEALYALGAVDGSGTLTCPRGETMALLPLEPQPGAFLLSSTAEGCEQDALTLAALLSVQSPFASLKPADHAVARAPFAVYEGDPITLLNLHRRYARQRKSAGERKASVWCKKHLLDERVLSRVGQVRRQLEKHLAAHLRRVEAAERAAAGGGSQEKGALCRATAGDGGTTGTDCIRRALVMGYFANAARHVGGGYYRSILRSSSLRLQNNSVLFAAPPEWIVFHETTFTSQELILSATKVEERWLSELAPHFYAREQRDKRMAPHRPAGASETMGTAASGLGRGLKRAAEEAAGGDEGAAPSRAKASGAAAPSLGRSSVAAMLGESLVKGGMLM